MNEKRTGFSEKEYRALQNRDSYSSLALFDKSRKKYYRKYILKEKDEEELSNAMILGNLCDCKLFTPEEFDERFGMSSVNVGTTQLFEFAAELYSLTLKALNEEGEITREFSELMKEAFDNVKYDMNGVEVKFKKKDFAWLVTNFSGSDAEIFYKERRANHGKIVVGINQIQQADNLIADLFNTEWTSDVLEKVDDERWEVLNQLNFDNFEVENLPLKFMADKVLIDHKNKEISPYDLKVTWIAEDFPSNYRKNRYYIQSSLYRLGLLEWIEKERPDLKEYKLNYMQFIVGDSTRSCKPLIFTTNEQDFIDGLMGFERNGYKYKGVLEICEEISWAKSMGLWDISKQNFMKNGIVEITTFEQNEE